MTQEQVVEFALIGFALMFTVAGFAMLMGGFTARARGQYEVQRLQARSAAFVRMVQGIGMFVISGVLIVAWLVFQNRANVEVVEQPVELAPTTIAPALIATDTPPADPTVLVIVPATQAPVEIIINEPTAVTLADPTEGAVESDATAEPEQIETSIPLATDAPPPPTEEPTPTPIPYDAVVNVVGGLNMRDSPNGNVVELLPNGSGVNLLNENVAAGNYLWQLVEAETGTQGWVAEDFIIYTGQ